MTSISPKVTSPFQETLLDENTPGVCLPVFDGPLDLLLFLIRKNEIDIYDIPIETVTRQYLDILNAMDGLNLDLAGEFFVMASSLLHIKSRMLLPQIKSEIEEVEEEEPVDPRWELVQQLVEYRGMKEASGDIASLMQAMNDQLPRIVEEPEAVAAEILPSDSMEIWNLFNLVMERFSDRMESTEIQREAITIAEQMELIISHLQDYKKFSFSTLLPEKFNVSYLVVTFLAVLELTRLKKLSVIQEGNYGEIFCSQREESLDE
jgi:segregation and condensation protein A